RRVAQGPRRVAGDRRAVRRAGARDRRLRLHPAQGLGRLRGRAVAVPRLGLRAVHGRRGVKARPAPRLVAALVLAASALVVLLLPAPRARAQTTGAPIGTAPATGSR